MGPLLSEYEGVKENNTPGFCLHLMNSLRHKIDCKPIFQNWCKKNKNKTKPIRVNEKTSEANFKIKLHLNDSYTKYIFFKKAYLDMSKARNSTL